MKIKLSRPSVFHGPRLKGELMVAHAAPRLRRAVLMTLENPECPVRRGTYELAPQESSGAVQLEFATNGSVEKDSSLRLGMTTN
jgi:hypothetical protein